MRSRDFMNLLGILCLDSNILRQKDPKHPQFGQRRLHICGGKNDHEFYSEVVKPLVKETLGEYCNVGDNTLNGDPKNNIKNKTPRPHFYLSQEGIINYLTEIKIYNLVNSVCFDYNKEQLPSNSKEKGILMELGTGYEGARGPLISIEDELTMDERKWFFEGLIAAKASVVAAKQPAIKTMSGLGKHPFLAYNLWFFAKQLGFNPNAYWVKGTIPSAKGSFRMTFLPNDIRRFCQSREFRVLNPKFKKLEKIIGEIPNLGAQSIDCNNS